MWLRIGGNDQRDDEKAMVMFKTIAAWFSNSGDGLVIKDLGLIDTVKVANIQYAGALALCRRETRLYLRLLLDRKVAGAGSRVWLQLYMAHPAHLERTLSHLLDKVQQAAPPLPNGNQRFDWIVRNMLKVTAGDLVHSYGRIDNHPTQALNQRVELFLFRRDTTFWLVFRTAGSDYHVWPITLAAALHAKMPELQASLTSAPHG
jgi:hypothetical protein